METGSIKPGGSVLKFEKGEYAYPRKIGLALRGAGSARGRNGKPFVLATICFRRVSTDIFVFSFVSRTRTFRFPLSISFFPTTTMYGIHSFSAVRIFFESVSSEASRSARTSGRRGGEERAYASWSPRT